MQVGDSICALNTQKTGKVLELSGQCCAGKGSSCDSTVNANEVLSPFLVLLGWAVGYEEQQRIASAPYLLVENACFQHHRRLSLERDVLIENYVNHDHFASPVRPSLVGRVNLTRNDSVK